MADNVQFTRDYKDPDYCSRKKTELFITLNMK